MTRLALGSDSAGLALKEIVGDHLRARGIAVVDFGVCGDEDTDYPDVARTVAEQVAAGSFDRAILICGTGIGMAIVANKVPGVRAAVCHDPYSAERARKSNDAQVMALGARVVGPELAKSLTDIWLASEFEGGRSSTKVAKIVSMDMARRTSQAPPGL